MQLQVNRTPEGIPQIEIHFEDVGGEAQLVLDAYGFDSEDDIAGILMDVAQSLHNNIPVHTRSQKDYDALMADRKLGETVRDAERRSLADEPVRRIPFNPQPRSKTE